MKLWFSKELLLTLVQNHWSGYIKSYSCYILVVVTEFVFYLSYCCFGLFSVPPKFVKTPTNIEVSVRDRQVLFRCLATGYPTPTITWRKDGLPLESDTRHVMTENGALNIIDPKFSDEGSYECVAQNSAGEIVSKAALNYFGVEGNGEFNFPVAKW